MEWTKYSTRMWQCNWSDDKTILTYIANAPIGNLRFFIFERYNRRGNLKDYVAYYKDNLSLSVSNSFAHRVKGSFTSYQAAMSRCEEIVDALLNNESIERYMNGTEYIDNTCPAGEETFD